MENKKFWNTDNPEKEGNYICDLGTNGVSLGWWNGNEWVKMWGKEPINVCGWIDVPQDKYRTDLPHKGQVVWVRDDEFEPWRVTHFIRYTGELYACSNMNNDNNPLEWHYLTTENPYEIDRESKIGDMVCVWDGDIPNYVITAELLNIDMDSATPFQIKMYGEPYGMYQHCSYKNPLMK